MKKIKALLLTLLSLSVVGAASGCSFDAVKALFDKTPDASTPSTSESPSDTGSSDGSTDGSTDGTPDDGGDVTPDDRPATPISGDGSDEAPYVIEAGKSYVASNYHSLDENEMDIWTNHYVIVSETNGTYTIDLLEDLNEFDVEVEIVGVDIPLDEENDYKQMADGFSFAVNAGKEVNFSVSSASWDTWPATYYDVNFKVLFDADTYEPDGNKLAPIVLENGATYTEEVSYPNTWYTFTAPSAGYYKLTVNADWANVEYGFNFYDADYNTFLRGAAVAIAEGETITFCASNGISDDEGNTIHTSWTFAFGAELENDDNYDVPVGASADNPLTISYANNYDVSIAAASNYYVVLEGALEFVVPEGLTATVGSVMNAVDYAAGDKITGADGEQLFVRLYNAGEATVNATLEVTELPFGTMDNPKIIYWATTLDLSINAGDSYYLSLNGALQFVVPEGLTAMTMGMNRQEFAAGATLAFSDYHPMMNSQLYVMLYNGGEETVYTTLSFQTIENEDIGGDEGGDVVEPTPIGSGEIAVETTDNYCWIDEYTFTATAGAGIYTFTVPTGLGFFSEEQMNLGWNGAPEIDYNDAVGGAIEVALADGEEYVFFVGALTKDTWTITWSAVAADVESGDDEGGDVVVDTVLEVGANTVIVAEENNSLETGVTHEFVPTEDGTYKIKCDLMYKIYDASYNEVAAVNYNYVLTANQTYYVVFYYFAAIGTTAGTYTATLSVVS